MTLLCCFRRGLNGSGAVHNEFDGASVALPLVMQAPNSLCLGEWASFVMELSKIKMIGPKQRDSSVGLVQKTPTPGRAVYCQSLAGTADSQCEAFYQSLPCSGESSWCLMQLVGGRNVQKTDWQRAHQRLAVGTLSPFAWEVWYRQQIR